MSRNVSPSRRRETERSPPGMETASLSPAIRPASIRLTAVAPQPVPQARVKSSSDGPGAVRPSDAHEGHVGPPGKGGAVAQGPAPGSESVPIGKGRLGHLRHRVGDARPAQLHIGAGDSRIPRRGLQPPDDRGVVQADLILLRRDPPPGDQPGGGADADMLRVCRQGVIHSVAGQTPGPVAAHLPQGAVGVVKEHAEVRLSVGYQDDEPVGPGPLRPAKPPGEDRKVLAPKLTAEVFRQHEGIPRAVHFGIAHLSSRFRPGKRPGRRPEASFAASPCRRCSGRRCRRPRSRLRR